ncbi:meiosis-specific protein ASY3 isoform X2 [Euphorbia lathyris]|uniref:meiosis-specific protein ASY3 isoform X2 n=1 Tax=Euphorbia lathyris TaxID=212925 RepID=UPI003313F1D2
MEVPMSDCRSFGSNLRPSSQSRKMSIGIMIDSQENKRSRATKEGNVIVSNTKRANYNEGDSFQGKAKGKIVDTIEEKENEAPEKVTSPWIDTRSFHLNTEDLPTTSTRRKNPGRAQDAKITHSVQSFAVHSCADGGKQQKLYGNTNNRMGSKVGNSQEPEECILGESPKRGAVDANEEKQTVAPENVTSPWIGTRSFPKKTTALPTTSTKWNKPGRAQDATITHSVQSFANNLHADGDKQQKFDGITSKRMVGKVGNSQKPEEFTFIANEVLVSDKAVTEDKKEEERSESLKKKIQEIFGTVSSPKSQPTISHVCDVGVGNLKPRQMHHQKSNAVVKPIQYSDTIETDSENPDCRMTRPVTRSLTRMRVATKVRPEKAKAGPLSSHEHKFQKKNIFEFEEGLFQKGDVVSGGSSMSARKKGRRKNPVIKPRKIYFTKNNNTDEIQRATCRNEMPPPVEKASSLSDKSRSFHGCSPQGENKCLEVSNRNSKGDSTQSARENEVDQQGDSRSPSVPMNEDQQEKFGNEDMNNVTAWQDETQSPTFKINTPTLISSPSSTPKSDQIGKRVYSPISEEEEFTLGNIYSLRNLQTSKADLHASNAKAESSDNAEVLEDSPPCKQFPFKGRKEAQEGLSESSSEDGDSKSSEEEFKERDGFSPETATAERSNFMAYPTKRLRNREDNSASKFSPTLPSPKGVDENNWTPEPSEPNQENELERIITLFALALENFRNKMKSATRKKSSEILKSVSEEIYLQLQNVESQIQEDVAKLIRISKSKRKRLETTFQEQQDKLKLIYDKFKEDIHQHLQDCKSTVKELEVHHVELKGTMKKQKASHEKLVDKVEEAVETQLNDADRRITAVNKSAKEKMLQLQQVIVECLKEDSL